MVAPVITSANTVSNVEGTVLSHTLTADKSVTWTAVGGADLADFEISGSTLRWVGNGVKAFKMWILSAGTWDDTLNWSDTEVWKDAA